MDAFTGLRLTSDTLNC